MPRRKPTPSEQLFIDLKGTPGMSGTQAVKIAFPNTKHPSQYAVELMLKPYVARAVNKIIDLRLSAIRGTAERATEMIAGIAEIDYGDYKENRNSKGIELLAKQHGLLVDKTDNVHRLGESEMAMAVRIAQEEREKAIAAPEDGPRSTITGKE